MYRFNGHHFDAETVAVVRDAILVHANTASELMRYDVPQSSMLWSFARPNKIELIKIVRDRENPWKDETQTERVGTIGLRDAKEFVEFLLDLYFPTY